MSYELQGKLIEKFDTQQVSEKFKKREFVVEKRETTGGREFVDTIKFQLTQDRCDLIDPYKTGEEVKVNFNIKGNRWEGNGRVNYFTNLDVWKIERVSSDNPDEQMQKSNDSNKPPMPDNNDMPPLDDQDDDLPF
ncbi:MAG: DUF3127 domain-containing protein [Bacteroidales bacterium]|nr:DUF3127 domain-containing protein [Bacteroidales bacterium]MCF8327778.1 DUF3127 domain-containing protein [Bacteroidales bacterium]